MEAARAANSADLEAVSALARQGTAELRVNRGGSVWHRREARPEPVDAALVAELSQSDPKSRAVVGTIDGVVVGYGIAATEDLHDGEVLAVISDLYVDPEARGIGVGEAMMDLLVQWAESLGAVGIDAVALPGDRHTKNFFETFGLKARAIVVHRELAAGQNAPPP